MTVNKTFSTIEEQLSLHGEHYATTWGDSMKPLFRTRGCTVKLIPYRGDAKRDDVVLWREPTGKYLLHRVVRVTEKGLVTRGDNRRLDDPEIPHDWVIAVLAGYYRKEKFVPLTSRRYRAYVRLWGRPNFIRAVWQRTRDLARRCVGRQPKN